jgi:hypothetical protein
MPSNVNPLVPTEGTATTASVRANFSHIKTELENLENADAYEITQRNEAIAQEAAARNAAIAVETSARGNAITDALETVAEDIADEASARINADADEANARVAGDAGSTAYADSIMATEESARIAGDSGVYDSAVILVDDEATARTSADNALDARLDTLEAVDSWHVIGATGEPAFSSGWSNLGGGWPDAAFKKLPNGLVIFRGLILCSSWAVYSSPFTLPVGYRPGFNTMFAVSGGYQISRWCPVSYGDIVTFDCDASFNSLSDICYLAV